MATDVKQAIRQSADMSRNKDLAGQTVYKDGYNITYNDKGFATKAVKSDSPAYAGHKDQTVASSGGTTTNKNMWTDEQILTAADLQKIADLRAQGAAGSISWAEANAQANAIRSGYGYTIDQSGTVVDQQAKDRAEAAQQKYGATQVYDKATGTYQPIVSAPQTNVAGQQGAVQAPSIGVQQGGAAVTAPSVSVSSVNDPKLSLKDYLDQWLEAAKKQQELIIDRGTGLAVNELLDAEAEAQDQFQTQRNQIAEDEAKAKDNQALYAERRGDRGGIGAAQYDSIMNTAAQNRLAVNSAQTKLATDTAKEVAQLRAQGEYEKADAMLTLTQQYLSQLMSLEQWSLEYGLSAAQFQASLEQWAKEYELSIADITGVYNGQMTLKGQQYQDSLLQDQRKQLASAGEALLSAGIMPSASQLEALGMTSAQAQDYLTAVQLAAAAKKSSGSGSGSGGGSGDGTEMDLDGLFEAASKNGGYSWLKQKSNYKKYGLDSAPSQSDYNAWLEENTYNEADVSGIAKAWYTDLYKQYASQQDRLNAIEKEWNNGNSSWMTQADLLYLLDKLHLR